MPYTVHKAANHCCPTKKNLKSTKPFAVEDSALRGERDGVRRLTEFQTLINITGQQ